MTMTQEVGTMLDLHDRGTELVASADSPNAITQLLSLAIDRGVSVETMEKLVALHERVADRAAAIEFAEALADFQNECPPIPRTSTANVATKSGTKFSYKYAELDTIAVTVRPLLHSRGFSYTWDSEIRERLLSCVCTLRHINGHRETATFTCPIESDAGMSAQQKVAAALTYAKRQALIQVLGITTTEPDTDAANPATITKEQAANLRDLLEQSGKDEARFLQYMGVSSYADIRASDLQKATNAIKAERRAK